MGAAVGYALAGWRAAGFAAGQLGPDDDTRDHSESVRNVLGGLADGARHIRSHPSVLRAFTVIGIHRFAYGVSAICTLLLFRNYFSDDGVFRAGLAGLGQMVAAVAIGGGLAALLTPVAARRIGYTRWPALLLMGAGVVELSLGLPFQLQAFLPAAALLGLAAQGVKICVDTLIAQRVADDYRGRVFSIYDTLFNVMFVAAGVVTALALPENGKSAVGGDVDRGGRLLVVGGSRTCCRRPDPRCPAGPPVHPAVRAARPTGRGRENPSPSSTGSTYTRISSTSPRCRHWPATSAPRILRFLPPAAASAVATASPMSPERIVTCSGAAAPAAGG